METLPIDAEEDIRQDLLDAEDRRQDLFKSGPKFQLTDESDGKAVSEVSWPDMLRVNECQPIRLALERKKVPSSSGDAEGPSEDNRVPQEEKPTMSLEHETDSYPPAINDLYEDHSPTFPRGLEPLGPHASVDPPNSTAFSVINGASSNQKDRLHRRIGSEKIEAHARSHVEQDRHVALPERRHSPSEYSARNVEEEKAQESALYKAPPSRQPLPSSRFRPDNETKPPVDPASPKYQGSKRLDKFLPQEAHAASISGEDEIMSGSSNGNQQPEIPILLWPVGSLTRFWGAGSGLSKSPPKTNRCHSMTEPNSRHWDSADPKAKAAGQPLMYPDERMQTLNMILEGCHRELQTSRNKLDVVLYDLVVPNVAMAIDNLAQQYRDCSYLPASLCEQRATTAWFAKKLLRAFMPCDQYDEVTKEYTNVINKYWGAVYQTILQSVCKQSLLKISNPDTLARKAFMILRT